MNRHPTNRLLSTTCLLGQVPIAHPGFVCGLGVSGGMNLGLEPNHKLAGAQLLRTKGNEVNGCLIFMSARGYGFSTSYFVGFQCNCCTCTIFFLLFY